jgi:hypothetical protein
LKPEPKVFDRFETDIIDGMGGVTA